MDRIFLSEPIIVTVGMKPSVFVSGTGFLNYKHLFKDIRKINYDFYLDSKSAYPDARFLNVCSYFRAVGEIESQGLGAVSARGAQTYEQIDPLAGQDLDIQLLKIMQSGQNESAQTLRPGQTESTQILQPGRPAPQTEKSILAGDKNVVPVYVRDFVPFIKKLDI